MRASQASGGCPLNIENAFGHQVHDPRSGEILSADVRMYHNVQKLVRDWY